MENITKFYIRQRNLFGKLSNTEQSGRNKLGFYMKITKISDVLKEQIFWKERLTWEGEDEWIFLAPHSLWCLTATFLRNENSLNLEIISSISNLVN